MGLDPRHLETIQKPETETPKNLDTGGQVGAHEL